MTSFRQVAAFLAAGVVCLASVAAPAFAQQRRVEQLYTADGIRLDFPADGVWRVKARLVAEAQARLLSRRGIEARNAPQAAVVGGVLQGTLSIPSFLVGFNNTDTTSLPKKAEYDSIFYTAQPKAGRAYTLKTFYEEMSNDVFHVAGQTYHWILGDSGSTYYLSPPNCSTDPLSCPQGRARLRELVVKALTQYDGTIDFAQLDNDGPDGTPNSGDDDGVVDLAQFVQSVRGSECSGPGYNAHHFSLAGLGGAYITLDPKAGGGNIAVNAYQLVAGVGGTTCVNDAQIMALGTAAHELGHGLGLPDLYDTGVPPTTEGVGEWSLMGSGNYASLSSPAHFDAWSMLRLGWVTPRELNVAGTYAVGQIQTADTVFLIRPLGSNPNNEYFLLENKQQRQSDTSNLRTGGATGPKLGGLLVWHIDSTKTDPTHVETLNDVNAGAIHGVALVQADGLRDLDRRAAPVGTGDRGDAGDPYPGSSVNRKFSYSTNPKAVKNSDTTAFIGFELDSVTLRLDSSMIFKLAFGGPTVVWATDTLAEVSVDGTKYRRFSQLLAPGSTHTVGIDSAQVTSDSLRQYVFQSWSDGGARSHDITGKLEGDTVTASVSTRFRVRATTSGAGTISAVPAGDIAAGVYVLKDSVISLKATPNSGRLFAGWSGDTTTSADSLLLTVSKKYTLTALFLDPLVAADVVSQILGTRQTLSAEHLNYLDRLGNNSGGFDVGDFLAWVNTTGAQAPEIAAALARLAPAGPLAKPAPRNEVRR